MIDENPQHDTERGSLSLEFIAFGLVVLVPLVYAVIAIMSVQQGMLATDAAARHVARTISLASNAEQADARTAAVLDTIWEQYALSPEDIEVEVFCTPANVPCPSAGAIVHVAVSARMNLPFVGGVPGLDRIASVPVRAEAVNRMGKAWAG